jgi:superfamily II DNA or RNA helicase
VRPVLDSVLTYIEPEPMGAQALIAMIDKLASDFPDIPKELLGGETVINGKKAIVWPRGWAPKTKMILDLRHKGPQVEIYLNEDKLDERASYQLPLLEEALKVGEEGIITSPTGSGKTVMATIIISKLQRRTLVVVNTTPILDQTRETIKRLIGIEAGIIGQGVRDVRPVTVALFQALKEDDPILKDIGLLLIDEAHHISAVTYLKILRACPAYYRYGLTATIKKTDKSEKVIHAVIGKTVAHIAVKELQAKGFLNKGEYRAIYTNAVAPYIQFVAERCWYYKAAQKEGAEKKCPTPCTYPQDDEVHKCVYFKAYFGWIYDRLAEDQFRNEQLLEVAIEQTERFPWVVVLTHRKKHMDFIAKELAERAQQPIWRACGAPEMKVKERRENIAKYKQHGGVLVATTGAIGEGFDAPKTGCLIRAMPSGGMVSVRQHTGRIMRPQEKKSLIIDLVDRKIPRLKQWWFGRQSIYKTIGFEPETKKKESDLFA